ncbi:type IV-A pilus assembly ATPase PilB [Vibrio sp. SM6]|uniref:Type IV-A pilus assembly ATPase PilB n=1 Tax=Vibrio agarilyticus TaxID=2726741 RepID=A0A7X8TRB0_9VIBR|nr:type IV-A pilus assembly ATPase PilB [Vibrio agarilyticus]NLS12793.1 type IV-A pilus assembly ATPase PilB [Vibrio agarilyticus]
MSHPIFELLAQHQHLSANALLQLEAQWAQGEASAAELLIRGQHIEAKQLAAFLAATFGLRQIELTEFDYAATCQQLGLRALITRHQALPLQIVDGTLLLALADPTSQQAEEEFRFSSEFHVEPVLCDITSLQSAIRHLYGQTLAASASASQGKEINRDELATLVRVSDDELEQIEDLSQDSAPVARFINQILLDAVRKGASDIHFEPYDNHYRVRLRCDGLLIETEQPPTQLSRRLSSRLKIIAKLDIAERRLPQDGRIKLRLNDTTAIDMRVSTLPTLFGEKIVLRLLESSANKLNLDQLGFNPQQKALYVNALKKPQGMILITGPTGSGKTVSLYAGLSLINRPEINIATAEDPIEINLFGINQVQIQPKIGLNFATALRAFLRQDPDVIMLGEIRDSETAEIAIKAAQTGHLLLSTLHTNSAAETVIRLTNMGIEAYNLAASLSLIIAQRLARRLCPHCKCATTVTAAQSALGLHLGSTIYRANPAGCSQCNLGYSGRVGLYEVMAFNSPLADAIFHNASAYEIERLSAEQGMLTLTQSGLEKVSAGITSFEELQRVLFID